MPAWNRIIIPKDKLEELYINQGLSIAKIANTFGYSTGPVHRSLREYKITIRNLSEACTKIKVSKQQLRKWYFDEKLSMFEIADRLGCTHSSIVLKFQKLGLKSRGHLGLTKRIKLTKKGFEYLYYTKNLSLDKIAKIAHCSESGLERRFKNYNLISRTIKNRACKYKKHDFSGDPIEKAYLIGFRLGDLNVKKVVSVTQVRCSSTIPAQIRLIKVLFSKYTTPRTTTFLDKRFGIPKIDIVCLVNKSFDFLLPKKDKAPSWILKNSEAFWAFSAGYADAEGCFYLKKPKKNSRTWTSGFEIQTQQKRIIYELWKGIQKFEIHAPTPKVSVKAGHINNRGNKNNKDMWRFTVSRKDSLWRLIHFFQPYIKHASKTKKIREIEKNIVLRNTIPHSHPINLSQNFAL